jgi:hypothetical protein
MIEQLEMINTLQHSIKMVLRGQKEDNMSKIENVRSLMEQIVDFFSTGFKQRIGELQVTFGKLVSDQFMLMKDMLASSGLSEYNRNVLVALGQMGFIEKLQEPLKSMKDMYCDDRINVANQLNDIVGRLNQMLVEKIGNLGP